MNDFGAIKLSCPSLAGFSGAFGTVYRALPPGERKRLRDILEDYLTQLGPQGAYERMNGRTVERIFAEYQPSGAKPIASGEIDGVQYRLYAPRAAQSPDAASEPNP